MVYIHNWRAHRPLFRVGTTPDNMSKQSHDRRQGEGNLIPTPPLKSCSHLGAGFVIKEFNPKMLPEVEKVNGTKVLCEHVSQVLIARDEVDRHFAIFDALTYIMIPNVNVFGPPFLDWV